MVLGEVAFGEIARAVRLVVQTVIGLRGVADVGGLAVIELVIEAAVVAIFIERCRDNRRRLGSQACALSGLQLRKSIGALGEAGALTLAFKSKETEQLVLDDGPPDGTSKKLAAVGSFCTSFRGKFIDGIELLLAEETEARPVETVRSGLGDHVDGSAFGAAVGGGKPLGADDEFLNSLERKLHNRSTHRVVLIIDTIDGYVDVAAAL